LPIEAQPTAVWSSPYARARQTAHAVLAALDSPLAVHVDERLRDKELGVLDTLTSHGIRARYPFEAQRRRWLGKFYYRAPGGESWADIALRLRSVLADLDRDEDGQRVLVVAHDAVVMLMRYVCEGLDEQALLGVARAGQIVNTGVTRLVRAGGSWRVTEFNRHDHLSIDYAGADLRTVHITDDDVLPG
jgi:broad specificity phosphatase PhoE